jgi:hypothetical protein
VFYWNCWFPFISLSVFTLELGVCWVVYHLLSLFAASFLTLFILNSKELIRLGKRSGSVLLSLISFVYIAS